MQEHQKAKDYQMMKIKLSLVSLALEMLLLVIFFFSGLSFLVRDLAAGLTLQPSLQLGIYIAVIYLGFYLVQFPLNVFQGLVWEHRHQLSVQTFGQWFRDDVKKAALGFIIALVLIEGVYAFIRHYPLYWWLGAGIFWLILSFILAKLTPNVIIPLFYKYSSIEDSELKDNIKKLFQSCSVPLKDVYSINFSSKTKKANAFVCGIGRNRRVVLSDTLLNQFTHSEVQAVVAHELGHYVHKDILKMLAINTGTILAGFYIIHRLLLTSFALMGSGRMEDIAYFPLVVIFFMLFGFVTTPFLNAFSRMVERRADRFSLMKTKNSKSFVSLMQKLGEINLSEFEPNRLVEIFFYDHPPLKKRIEFAENFAF